MESVNLEGSKPVEWVNLCSPDAELTQPGSPDDLFIAVMGMTGAGKSTFIEHCTNSLEQLSGHELASCRLLRRP